MLATTAIAAATAVSAQTPVLDEGDFLPFDARAAAVGRLLFYDPILSGNRDISCGTCHHHDHASADGLSLGIGAGGVGVGPERVSRTGPDRIVRRVPRNAPGLWNLGAREVRVLFHDGRLLKSPLFGNGFNSPAENAVPDGINGILAAQALFPITSETEMAGRPHENEIARAARRRPGEAWALLTRRVRAIPEYGAMLTEAFDDIDDPAKIEIRHIANALGDFMNAEFRSFDSPYDAHLAGDTTALTPDQARGMALFFGAAGCGSCHKGRLLSDQKFHALALPPFGPGRTRRFDPVVRDLGHMGESDDIADAYRFRTPPLRNVAATAPYGHNGAYRTLEGIVRHHLDPLAALAAWTPDMALLPRVEWLEAVDFLALDDGRELARLKARIDIAPRGLSDAQVADVVAFLGALTGRDSLRGRLGRPRTVPSGLRVD